jgi:Carboxypeptidase regulatory-like domain
MFIIILIALASQSLSAQSAMTGSMRGAVRDNDKVALPGVLIILSETTASLKKTANYSDINGKFEFKDLAPGTYHLTAELSGFETVSIKEIIIQPGDIINLEIILRLRLSTSKIIIVIPEPPLLNPKVTVPPQEILQKDFLEAPLLAKRISGNPAFDSFGSKRS